MQLELLKAYFLRILSLTPTELNRIVSFYREQKIRRGEFILKKGEVCNFEGYVIKGCFKVGVTDDKGVERVLYFAAEDWWVMEINSFANQTLSELDIQAIEDSTLLVISRKDKEALYQAEPKAERLFRLMYQKAVAAWQKRLIRNHTMNAEERYEHFVSTYPDIAQRVTNKLISGYLGITQEFLSMIRKRRTERKN